MRFLGVTLLLCLSFPALGKPKAHLLIDPLYDFCMVASSGIPYCWNKTTQDEKNSELVNLVRSNIHLPTSPIHDLYNNWIFAFTTQIIMETAIQKEIYSNPNAEDLSVRLRRK